MSVEREWCGTREVGDGVNSLQFTHDTTKQTLKPIYHSVERWRGRDGRLREGGITGTHHSNGRCAARDAEGMPRRRRGAWHNQTDDAVAKLNNTL